MQYSTRENYLASLNQFEKFCKKTYNGRTSQDILNELQSLNSQRDDAFLGLLQDFVNWMANSTLSHATIHQYFQIVLYYFSYQRIRIHPLDLKQNVKLPKKIKKKLELFLKVEPELDIFS